MTHLLFVAHDPGGARYLSAVKQAARGRGDHIDFLGRGPALRFWREEGESVFEQAIDAPTPDMVVSGTSFGEFERSQWPEFKSRGVPILAAIDAWTNFTTRFENDDGEKCLPSAITVIDAASRDRLVAKPWCDVPVHVTGQPHLEVVVPRLRAGREGRTGCSGTAVFFSEPIDNDIGRAVRGYDQYDIAATLVETFKGPELLIKPHPRDDVNVWRDKMAPFGISISDEQTADLLVRADGVLGMTTMVLLEAALAGVPCLSLQMGRLSCSNPVIDRFVPFITQNAELDAALQDWMAKFGGAEDATHVHLFDGAIEHFLAAIDATLN